jgi:hypothetical protein
MPPWAKHGNKEDEVGTRNDRSSAEEQIPRRVGLFLRVCLLHVIVIVHEILIDAWRRVGRISRDSLPFEIVQSVFETCIFLDKILVALLIHLVTMVVNPEVSIALAAIQEPQPEERAERIAIDHYGLRSIGMENRFFPGRS